MARIALAALAFAALFGGSGSAARRTTCPNNPRLGEVAYVRGGTLRVLNLGTCGDRVLVERGVQGPVRFSRDGRTIAYGNGWAVRAAGGTPRRAVGPAGLPSPNGRLIARIQIERLPGATVGSQKITVAKTGTRRGRVVYTVRESYRRIPGGSPGPLGLVAWSPDSRWLFFYIDPMGSASLAADGRELEAVSVRTGLARPVARTLLYADYLTWCGRRLVLTAGGSRLATENKWLAFADAPGWGSKPLIRERKRAWSSIACRVGTPTVAALSQPVSHNFSFENAHWSIWLVGLDGSRRRLTVAPKGTSDESPRWSHDGATLLFVRRTTLVNGTLMLLTHGRLLGPLTTFRGDIGYYGHHDWWSAADWWQPRVR